MEEIKDGKITGAIDAITLKKIENITEQMKNCICKVYGEETGTGFFCKIQYEGKTIPVLMTNYHIISDVFLKSNKVVKISTNDGEGEEYNEINIDENSKIYSSIKEKYDIMIIKVEEEKYLYDYLELDNHLFDENIEKIYENKSIYIFIIPWKKFMFLLDME